MTSRGLQYNNNADWMASPGWQDLKRRVLKAQGGDCADCGINAMENRGPLELHHEVYPHEVMPKKAFLLLAGGYPWGDEDEEDMAVLCRECHRQRHVDYNGDFWTSQQEKDDHWFGFNWAMDKDD